MSRIKRYVGQVSPPLSGRSDKAREDWNKTIDQILALQPAIVVPGHEGPGAKHDVSAIAFMKKYMADWDANVSENPGMPLRCV